MNANLAKLSVVAAVAGCAFSARADVDYTIANAYGTTPGSSGYQDLDTLNVEFNGNSSSYENILAGGIVIEPTGTTSPTYVTVCTDFLGSLYLGKSYEYSASASFSTAESQTQSGTGGIAPAWNNNSSGYAIQNAAQIFYTYGDVGTGGINTGGGTPLTVDQMAALQVAIWIALYDTTSKGTIGDYLDANTSQNYFVLEKGDSYSAVLGCVNADLAGLNGNYNHTGNILQPDPLTGSQSSTDQGNPDGALPQELLMGLPGNNPQVQVSTPEPTTVFAGALLLLPLGVSAIRILRKSKNN